ncbi:tRNA (N6-threonylcarbamoyladenosine(37)-N6)-methyltransferase TrmO [Litoribrevibacter albus]|uniref:tRNA (N6-threonylcarbamoyladenosine(37)-N6)-methyltransferase TrmO n=1 Tax=Litoribrevibacter albus TaxID=1473156 RepID=A0AA37S5S2_9GAMM|nr:tRNA (N6-threonylcarbamoyladenosine(37)-N6)-methyltransferase TrmO [Litoribrevibacter albus]GLQ29766.1 tRNA (N6-threonylcarbamoyladenosine(37)-N6)-methyltransferase TrmO [Litoribrevibacter albus]
MQLTIEPIGIVHSPYKQKFGIPRQPGLVTHASGVIEILGKYNRPEAFEGIEQYSHLWLEFYFHQTADKEWKPSVRPPRLGGNKKIGCFATRSNFRPNNIGLSVVQFKGLEIKQGQVKLHIAAHDLLDQTPILDIKPYIPYSDALPQANAGIFEQAPETTLSVELSSTVESKLVHLENRYPNLTEFIYQVLAQDPRPAYMKAKANRDDFSIQLYDLDIKWRVQDKQILVTDIISV